MGNHKTKRTILFVGIVCTLFFCKPWNGYACADEYRIPAVGHEELSMEKDGRRISWNHPYRFTERVITKVLSNISYKEKGLFKRKSTFMVFQDKEIQQLVPLLIRAFSVATPTQMVTVSSYWERAFFTDRHTYCVLFITDHKLNVVFSRVHKFQTYNDIMSEKKRHYYTMWENPLKKRHSGFWRLVPSSGQHLEFGHENWLVIDVSNQMYR